MRIVDTLLVLIGLVGLAILGWWGWSRLPETARAIESDLQIAAQDELQRAGLSWAQVTMDGQVATVRGTQTNSDLVSEAIQTVLTSSGNGGLVHGGVTVVRAVVDAPPVVSPYEWSAILQPGGALVLDGFVPSDAVRASLVEQAETLGAMGVVDEQALASGVPNGTWPSVAGEAVNLLLILDAGEASLRDLRFTLRGRAMDSVNRSRALAGALSLPEPYVAEVDIMGPGRWSARHFRDQLILSGEVESEGERAEIVEIASAHYGGEIVDEMVVGAPQFDGWMAGVRLGLPQFSRFTRGEMAFDPGGVGYRFEGEASGSTMAFLGEDMAALESPYGVSMAVSAAAVALDEVADIDFEADPRAACEEAFASVLATNKVVFETGSAAISRESGETLDKIMAVAGRCDGALVFELAGHTDAQGSRAANIALSEARAQAVANYMGEAGFDDGRLLVIGYGPDRPIGDNGTAEGRAENRRLEFKVLERSE